MEDREHQIEVSKDTTYDWIFTPEAQDLPEVHNLVNFLNTGSGLFWISGEAASGKSSFMKYIARPRREGSDLWQWNGSSDFTIVRHFCFIAGLEMQKTQLGLLRTLLLDILKAEPGLVSKVCPDVSNAGLGQGPWSVRDLRDSLQRAVQAKSGRFCIFVDGLDEIHKETELDDIVCFLKHLASHKHVKMIISSRPWRVFQGHCAAKDELHMKSINTKAIVSHLKSTLGSLADFLDVSWQCQTGSVWCKHDSKTRTVSSHGMADRLIFDLLHKAQGNFLWIYLVSNSIRSRSVAGLSMASILKKLDETPSDLSTYFRDMILERLDKDLRSETAMALSIALLPNNANNWTSFWQLLNHCNDEEPSLANPDFAMLMPYKLYDRPAVQKMIRQTGDFLDQCGRDILDTGEVGRRLTDMEDCLRWDNSEIYVTFTHRTAYDFFKTREMEDLLNERIPQTFRDVCFPRSLLIARAKMQFESVAAGGRRAVALEAWIFIDFAFGCSSYREPPQGSSRSAKLNKEAGSVGLHYLLEFGSPLHDPTRYKVWEENVLIRVCDSLASHDCYDTVDTILERWPALACSTSNSRPGMSSYALGSLSNDVDNKPLNLRWLSKLLAAGNDPNRPFIFWSVKLGEERRSRWSTPWCTFLRTWKNHVQGLPAHGDERDPAFMVASHQHLLSSDVKSAIKILLEFGADLQFGFTRLSLSNFDLEARRAHRMGKDDMVEDGRIDPLAVLHALLPMDADSEWPQLLEHYLKPETRQKIQKRRQKILENWPSSYRPEALTECA